MDASSCVCLFFDVDAGIGGQGQSMYKHGDALVLQFQTRFSTPGGRLRLRIQTVARTWVSPEALEVRNGLDQEAAAVAMAKCVPHCSGQHRPFSASCLRPSFRFAGRAILASKRPAEKN